MLNEPENLEPEDSEEEEFAEQESDLFSDSELDDALDKLRPPWVIPSLIGAAAIVVVVVIWMFGGALLSTSPDESQEELAALDTTTQVATDTSVAEPVEKVDQEPTEMIDSIKTIPDKEPESAQTLDEEDLTSPFSDTMKTEKLPGMSMDELYVLLNATLTDEESAELDDKTLEELLNLPFIPTPEIPTEGVTEDGVRTVPAEEADLMDTTAVIPDTTTILLAEIDSLVKSLDGIKQNLNRTEGEKQMLQVRLDRLKDVADSVRAAEIKKLAKILNVMDPASAAAMLQQRSQEELVEILLKIKPRKAAQIIRELPPAIGDQFAERVIGK